MTALRRLMCQMRRSGRGATTGLPLSVTNGGTGGQHRAEMKGVMT